jgi:hypothetical protein
MRGPRQQGQSSAIAPAEEPVASKKEQSKLAARGRFGRCEGMETKRRRLLTAPVQGWRKKTELFQVNMPKRQGNNGDNHHHASGHEFLRFY